MDYKKFARGIYVKGNQIISIEKASQYDFIVGEIGSNCANTIQVAHDVDIPFILFTPSMLGRAVIDQGPDVAEWKTENQPCIKELDRAIYSNGVKRIIHAIMVDCSAVEDEKGKPISAWWITVYSDWLLKKIWQRYGIPVYLYMNKQPYALANSDGREMLISLIAEWGLCTVTQVQVIDGYPAPQTQPDIIYNDTDLISLYFWLYNTGADWQWLYMENVDRLRAVMGMTDSTENTSMSNDDLWETLREQERRINDLTARIAKLENWKNMVL